MDRGWTHAVSWWPEIGPQGRALRGSVFTCTPENTSHRPNAGSILFHRLRRWPNIEPALCLRLVFAGTVSLSQPRLSPVKTTLYKIRAEMPRPLWNTQHPINVSRCPVLQSWKAVTAHLKSKQLLHFWLCMAVFISSDINRGYYTDLYASFVVLLW